MTSSAFTNPGKFWRGNLHTHSTNSDGVLSPEEVCERYQAEGYDFIALTDHFIGQYDYPISDTTSFRNDSFTTLLGAELHSGEMHNGELWHILAVGLPHDFAPGKAPNFRPVDGQETGPQIAQRARDAGAYVVIAHPQWSGMNLEDARSIDAAHAVETYNHGCEVSCDRADGFHTLDLLLSEDKKLNLCATDDAHFADPDHFGGWVMVKSLENEPKQLLEALKAGAYYSTQGPALHNIAITDNEIQITCSPVNTVVIQGHGSATMHENGSELGAVTFALDPFMDRSLWLRVTIIDENGKKAWSNPVWL